jgi:hypothetical protein
VQGSPNESYSDLLVVQMTPRHIDISWPEGAKDVAYIAGDPKVTRKLQEADAREDIIV